MTDSSESKEKAHLLQMLTDVREPLHRLLNGLGVGHSIRHKGVEAAVDAALEKHGEGKCQTAKSS